jgi:hypothetical protein
MAKKSKIVCNRARSLEDGKFKAERSSLLCLYLTGEVPPFIDCIEVRAVVKGKVKRAFRYVT